MFFPPIHFFYIFILRQIIGEPSFVPERNVIGEVWSKGLDCRDIKMIIVRTNIIKNMKKECNVLTYKDDVNGGKRNKWTRRIRESRRTKKLRAITFSQKEIIRGYTV